MRRDAKGVGLPWQVWMDQEIRAWGLILEMVGNPIGNMTENLRPPDRNDYQIRIQDHEFGVLFHDPLLSADLFPGDGLKIIFHVVGPALKIFSCVFRQPGSVKVKSQ